MRKGWRNELLKNACKVFTDGNWIESKDQSTEGIRLVQTGNIGFGFFRDKEDKARYISEETFERLKCTEILPGDLLVSRLPDPVGKSCIIPDLESKMITGVDCTIIRPKEHLLSEYLGYYQMSHQYLKDVESRVSGTTRSRISRKNLGLIEIPIPPLSEQKQIVEILDKAFAAIDQAKANIEKNIENAKELFQSEREQTFRSAMDFSNGESAILKKICTIKTGKLNANAMVENGQYPFFTCSREIYSINEYAFDTEAVLLAGNNASGDFNVKYYKGKFNAYQRTYVITINNNGRLDYSFLKHKLEHNLQVFKKQSVGANTRFLKIGMINELEVPLPPINVQQNLCLKLDKIYDQTNTLMTTFEKKLSSLEELKKSILQKAFVGELIKEETESILQMAAEPGVKYKHK